VAELPRLVIGDHLLVVDVDTPGGDALVLAERGVDRAGRLDGARAALDGAQDLQGAGRAVLASVVEQTLLRHGGDHRVRIVLRDAAEMRGLPGVVLPRVLSALRVALEADALAEAVLPVGRGRLRGQGPHGVQRVAARLTVLGDLPGHLVAVLLELPDDPRVSVVQGDHVRPARVREGADAVDSHVALAAVNGPELAGGAGLAGVALALDRGRPQSSPRLRGSGWVEKTMSPSGPRFPAMREATADFSLSGEMPPTMSWSRSTLSHPSVRASSNESERLLSSGIGSP